MKKAAIITPAYSHVDHQLLSVVLASGYHYRVVHGNADLPRARSYLLTEAMGEAERVICLDADVVISAEQLEYLVTTPEVDGEHALVGLYPLRDGKRWSAGTAEDLEHVGQPGLFRVESAGLGIAAIDSESLRRAAAELPLAQSSDASRWFPFCLPFVRDGRYYSEDAAFFDLLRRTGTVTRCKGDLIAAHCILVNMARPWR